MNARVDSEVLEVKLDSIESMFKEFKETQKENNIEVKQKLDQIAQNHNSLLTHVTTLNSEIIVMKTRLNDIEGMARANRDDINNMLSIVRFAKYWIGVSGIGGISTIIAIIYFLIDIA